MSREVTVYSERSVYRARVEEASKGFIRKRPGWRFVIESRWSRVSDRMAHEEDWHHHRHGPFRATRDEAVAGAEKWLDDAEHRNADRDDYV